MTHHELINLIMQLPPGCQLDREMNGESADWRTTDHLLAQYINDTRHYRSGKKQLPADKLINPPGSEAAKPKPKPEPKTNGHKQLGAAELDALFTGGG
jgi:hypothetical protein